MVRTARLPRALLALAACALSTAAAPAAAAPSAPTPGSPGLGDRQFPLLGNGGDDGRHYVLAPRHPPASPPGPVHGSVSTLAPAPPHPPRLDPPSGGRGPPR